MRKNKVHSKVCPKCESTNCEEVIKTDGFMLKGKKRTTWLCYDCGASETTPPVIA